MSQRPQKFPELPIDCNSLKAQAKTLTYQLRAGLNTALILSEFISESRDNVTAEYAGTICSTLKAMVGAISDFENALRNLSTDSSGLSLPRSVVPKKRSISSDPKLDTVRSKNQNASILVVEDNSISQTLIKRMLENLGFAVTIAGTGEEAVSVASMQNFELILMDISLPGIDGYETTRRILDLGRNREMPPIVALSAWSDDSDKQEAFTAGMTEFVCKPVDRNTLSGLIKRLLVD